MLALLTMLLPAFESPDEKTFHINKPEYAKIGYGIPSEGTFKRLPKKKEKIIIVNKGCNIAQRKPKNACLYFILISRHVKK